MKIKNKRIIILVLICLVILTVYFISEKSKENVNINQSSSRDEQIEQYVTSHYLDAELLNYMVGGVTPENKMTYVIEKMNSQLGQRQKEIKLDDLKSKYVEIFAEEPVITEAMFLLSNNYEFEHVRGTFLDKGGVQDDKKDANMNSFEVVGSKYDKSLGSYVVTIEEKTGDELKQVVRTMNMELKSNGNGGFVIDKYYSV